MKKDHIMRKDHKEAKMYNKKEKKEEGKLHFAHYGLKNGTLPTCGPIC